MVKRVCLVSSGTGGHLLPAMMLGHALRAAGHDTVLLTEGRQAERVLLERWPCRAESLSVGGSRLGLPLRLVVATLQARRFLQREGIDLVVGTGGVNSIPVSLAAASLRVPVALMEQNAVPGRANRWLAPLARRIYFGLPTTHRQRRGMLTGTPVRPGLGEIPTAKARASLGLDATTPVVLVTGGSQGARVLNELVPQALCLLPGPLQVLHLCGSDSDEAVRLRYSAGEYRGLTAVVRSYAMDMPTWFAAADLVICRGGGGTVAELAAAGRAAVIVPYPHHRDRQQVYNGKVLENAGAALVVEQHNLTVEGLATLVHDLLRSGRTATMAAKAHALARKDSCARILEDLCELEALD